MTMCPKHFQETAACSTLQPKHLGSELHQKYFPYKHGSFTLIPLLRVSHVICAVKQTNIFTLPRRGLEELTGSYCTLLTVNSHAIYDTTTLIDAAAALFMHTGSIPPSKTQSSPQLSSYACAYWNKHYRRTTGRRYRGEKGRYEATGAWGPAENPDALIFTSDFHLHTVSPLVSFPIFVAPCGLQISDI